MSAYVFAGRIFGWAITAYVLAVVALAPTALS